MIGYAESLEMKYMPYAIVDENGDITGFAEDAPEEARQAAREHIEMSRKFDDISNYDYWDNLIKKLKL